jgi:HEAT repeat protein
METKRTLRIVVASPADVQAEREALPAIIEELNRGIAGDRGLMFELSSWENDGYPGLDRQGPQGLLDKILKIENCDVLIGIFWKRFGTPTPTAASGTEHEILQAYESWEAKGHPHVLIYFNQKPFGPPKSKQELEQWARIIDFKERFSGKGLLWQYKGKSQFEKQVRTHLTKIVRNQPDYRREVAINSQTPPALEAQHPESGSPWPVQTLIDIYLQHLRQTVGTVRVFGAAELQPLEKVFVELNVTADYERPVVHLEWLGLMDAELRWRRNVFARNSEGPAPDDKNILKPRRTITPDDLLRETTKAVITGAPGSGKTTLVKYLALKTLNERKRLPVLLELKSVTQQAFTEVKEDLVELLLQQSIAGLLRLDKLQELESLKKYFLDRLKRGEVSIFLDGLDEVRGEKFFPSLCKSVNAFERSAYRENSIIITTRPYALEARFEGLVEMEIAPLNRQQVQAFLYHYHGDTQFVRALSQQLRRRRELTELARVPFLLGVISEVYRHQGEIVGARLELYRQLVTRLVVTLDKEKSVERFVVNDPGGFNKREILKRLAYDRLFVDPVSKDIERLVFTDDEILRKARHCSKSEADDLVADVIATPLLREVGANTYAFAHLTLQEYLAAEVLSEQSDCDRIFCQTVFNSTIAEMEVLPMVLGLVRDSTSLYRALEELPDSLTFTNLRLRARGLAYTQNVDQLHLTKLTDRLLYFMTQGNAQEAPYLNSIFHSFYAASTHFLEFVADRVKSLLISDNADVRWKSAKALGMLGDARAVGSLLTALTDTNMYVRRASAEALEKIDDIRAVDQLLGALKDRLPRVRWTAVKALGEIGDARAVEALLGVLKSDDYDLRRAAAQSLERIGDARSLERLLLALKDEDFDMRRAAAEALGQLGSERAIGGLVTALRDKEERVRWAAAGALKKIGSSKAVEGLLGLLQETGERECEHAIEVLGEIGDARAVDALLEMLLVDNINIRVRAADALGQLGDPSAVDGLLAALKDYHVQVRRSALRALFAIRDVEKLLLVLADEDPSVRWATAETLGEIGDQRAVKSLLEVLGDEAFEGRQIAAIALGKIGDPSSVEGLLQAMEDHDTSVRRAAARALGDIGDSRAVSKLITALNTDEQSVRGVAARSLGKIKDLSAIGALLSALKHNDSWIRRVASEELEKMSDVSVQNEFLRALKDDHPEIRQVAATVLGEIGHKDSVVGLLEILTDKEQRVSVAATEALGKIGDNRAVNSLLIVLKSEDPQMREFAAHSLGQIADARAVEGLVDALKDPESGVRMAATGALEKINDPRAAQGLLEALKDETQAVRKIAIPALGRRGVAMAADGLIAALQDEEQEVRLLAVVALKKIGDESMVDRLLSSLRHGRFADRLRLAMVIANIGGVRSVQGLLEALQDSGFGVRLSAADALGKIEDNQLAKGLEAALLNESDFVREKAAEVIGYYARDAHVLEMLHRLSQYDENLAVRRVAAEAHAKFQNKLKIFS